MPLFEEILAETATGYYCPISWVELLCYPALTEAEANQIRDFLRQLQRVDLTESILDAAAQIRRDYRVALADAMIAACALATASTLVTRNSTDFSRINGLTLSNPFESNAP
ncbi:MAG: type II toxin-antitoxin system VapC family toxin [Leptolyngbyaceae cyanobacterium bins.349]|nr:type II toxin-antitoxin system VapC family toxin [Leptolyngbyaceae cyanobacterium bins.349]